jgi:hypothetical protein
MSTYELLREGVMTVDRRLIAPGAMHWRDDEPIPVIQDGEVVGMVTNIRREGSSINGDLSIDLPEGMRLICSVVENGMMQRADGVLEVTNGRLEDAHVSDESKDPWKESE